MKYTAAVIGAGSGGLTVAIGLAGMGRSVALIEAAEVGGDCTNRGCIPSKTLIHLARSGNANPFGQVRDHRDDLRDRETHEMGDTENVTLILGRAAVLDSGRVEVAAPDGTTQVIESDNVVLATGSRPRPLAIEGLPDDALLTSDNLWELQAPPQHLVIVGAGPIGMEMASAFRRLGSAVTVVDMAPQVLPREDPDVAEIVRAAAEQRGIAIHTGTFASGYSDGDLHLDSGVVLSAVDKVLVAIGRVPNVENLNLEAAGVKLGKRGIEADTFGETSVKGIYAVGDVTGRTLTTHGANAMGRRTIRAIGLPRLPKRGAMPSIPNVTFADPEVASVGLSVDELAAVPEESRLRLRTDYADTDRGYTDDVQHGAVIVDVERFTGKILRASIVGPAAGEAIGLFTLAIDQDIGMLKIYRMVHPYPTYAGAIMAVADNYARATLLDIPGQTGAWAKHLPGKLWRRLRSLFG